MTIAVSLGIPGIHSIWRMDSLRQASTFCSSEVQFILGCLDSSARPGPPIPNPPPSHRSWCRGIRPTVVLTLVLTLMRNGFCPLGTPLPFVGMLYPLQCCAVLLVGFLDVFLQKILSESLPYRVWYIQQGFSSPDMATTSGSVLPAATGVKPA